MVANAQDAIEHDAEGRPIIRIGGKPESLTHINQPGDDVAGEYFAKRGMGAEAIRDEGLAREAEKRDAMKAWTDFRIEQDYGGPEMLALEAQKAGNEHVAEFFRSAPENFLQAGDQTLSEVNTFLMDTLYGYRGIAEFADEIGKELVPELYAAIDEMYARLEADDTAGDEMAQMLFQYLTPFMGSLKVLNTAGRVGNVMKGGEAALTTGQMMASTIGADLATSYVALDPHFDRLSDLLVEWEGLTNTRVIGPFVEYIASDGGTDAENRFRNVLDTMVASGFVGTLLGIGKIARQTWLAGKAGQLGGPLPGSPASQEGMVGWHGSPTRFEPERLVMMPSGELKFIKGTGGKLPEIPEGAELIQDFPAGRFSMDKIGTGEGRQAFGYGLYFAESKGVAGSYMNVAMPSGVFWDEPLSGQKGIVDILEKRAERTGDYSLTLSELPDDATGVELYKYASQILDTDDLGKFMDELGVQPGNIYEVDIPDESIAKMLDWDKPLSEQPDVIQQRIAELLDSDDMVASKVREEMVYDDWKGTGYDAEFDEDVGAYVAYDSNAEIVREGFGDIVSADSPEELMDEIAEILNIQFEYHSPTGGDVLKAVQDATGGPEAASRWLNDKGIPGIKYLDQQSRSAGEGTRNIVLFDEKLATITKVNDEPVKQATQAATKTVKQAAQATAKTGEKVAPYKGEFGDDVWYHGGEGAKADNLNDPAFLTTDKSGAEWFAGETNTSVGAYQVRVANPLNIDTREGAAEALDLAEKAGLKLDLKGHPLDGGTWDFDVDISEYTQYSGDNMADLMYVPAFREALEGAGYDGLKVSDPLSNGFIETVIPTNAKKSVSPIKTGEKVGGAAKGEELGSFLDEQFANQKKLSADPFELERAADRANRVAALRENDDNLLPNLARVLPDEYLPEVTKSGAKTVKVYRSIPDGMDSEIRAGDWVALDREYAESLGRGQIVELEVSASDVAWAGTDMNEFFYVPKVNDEPVKKAAQAADDVTKAAAKTGEKVGDEVVTKGGGDVHPDSLLPERVLSDRIDAGESITGKDYFTRKPEGELETAILKAMDDAASGKATVKRKGKVVPIGAPRGSTSFAQAIGKIAGGIYDGEKYTKKAILARANAMVKDGTILRPEKQMADEIIFNVTKDLDAGSAERGVVQSAIYDGDAPFTRKRAVGEVKFRGKGSLAEATDSTIKGLNNADPTAAAAATKAAKKLLEENYEVKKLLSQNRKLESTEKGKKKVAGQGEEGTPLKVTWIDGTEQKVETTGLSLMQAYREGKVAICAKPFSCKDNCLGFFAGGNFQYGGGNNPKRLESTRRTHFMTTQAWLRDPEAFITVLDAEVKAAQRSAVKKGNKLGVRLNTLSDIPPPVYESLIRNNPDVMFYDYTKLGSKRLTNADGTPLANHHLTYSATGINHPHQNWNQMTKVLDRGDNITMVFTTKEGADLPKFVLDEKTGKKYKVVDGDTHDYRPADQTPDGVDGVVVGLRNKDARIKGKSAAEQVKASKGFAVPHDGGDTVNIPPQFSPKRGPESTMAGMVLPPTWFLMQFPHWGEYNPELAAELEGS